jgi:hypothetical protein
MPHDSHDPREPKTRRCFPIGLAVAFLAGLVVGSGGVALGGYLWLSSRRQWEAEFEKRALAREHAMAAEQRANLKATRRRHIPEKSS